MSEPLLESSELLFFGDEEEKLQDRGIVFLREKLFPVIDELEAPLPDLFRDKVVHPHDQNVLVVRTVKDRHATEARRMGMDPPQKIVVALFRRWLLETHNIDPLRVHCAHDMPTRPVLARSINPLQDNEQRVPAVGVKFSLQIGDAAQIVLELGLDVVFGVIRAMKIRVDIGELDLAARVDLQPLGEVHGDSLSVRQSKMTGALK